MKYTAWLLAFLAAVISVTIVGVMADPTARLVVVFSESTAVVSLASWLIYCAVSYRPRPWDDGGEEDWKESL